MQYFGKSSSDPSCQYPQLIKPQNLSLPDHTNLDLLPKQKPSLNETPLSNFSIREYVSSARKKDIKTNWPFSLKSLEVCLRHGVKDILPPFEPFDSLREQCFDRSITSGIENEEAGKSREEADGPSNCAPLGLKNKVQPSQKICGIASTCEAALETGSSSKQASVSRTEVEFIPVNRQSCPLIKPSAEVEAAKADCPLRKSVYRDCASTKKRKLIVKRGSNTQSTSKENIGSSYAAVSETMASKVCPVCNTFSTSSNTTLNAHIDLCLSGEPALKCNANTTVPRHRVKSKQIRLMADVDKTTNPCTAEDLDPRNEERDHVVPQAHREDTEVAGDVYIDSDGTKLRILSKSDNLPSASKVQENTRPGKQMEGSKFSLTRKKRLHTEKEKDQMHLKRAHQSKKSHSHVNHNSQVSEDEEKSFGADGNLVRGDGAKRSTLEQLGALGTLPQWKGSKRSALAKKVNRSGLETFRVTFNVPPKEIGGDRTIRSHTPTKRNASHDSKWRTSIGDAQVSKYKWKL